jgi:hypothetical protein
MKTFIRIKIIGLALLFVGVSHAAEITVTFDNVPAGVQCGQTWTNNNIILSFNETTADEGNSAGYCSFGVDPGDVWLYPSRLILDFSLLNQPVSSITVSVAAYGNTGLFAYNGTNRIGQDQNPSSGSLSLNFTNPYPNYCAISSSEGRIDGISVITGIVSPPVIGIEQTNGAVTVLWPTNQNAFVLESSSNLTNPSGWMAQTNNIQFDGTNLYYTIAIPAGIEFFRLRH